MLICELLLDNMHHYTAGKQICRSPPVFLGKVTGERPFQLLQRMYGTNTLQLYFFALVISNFTLCFHNVNYLHWHIPSLTPIQNIFISVLSMGMLSYLFFPALSTPSSSSSCSAFSYPIPSLHCWIVPTAIQS